jgi:hypothetical protein
MNKFSEIPNEDLEDISHRARLASVGPWIAFVEGRDHHSGDSFIRIGDPESDMYVTKSQTGLPSLPVSAEDLDFIAHARQDVPRLLDEVRRLRALIR